MIINIGELKSQIISSNKFKIILLATPLIVGTGIYLYYYYNNDCNKKKKSDNKSNRKKDPLQNQLTQALNLKEKGNDLFRQKRYDDAIQQYSDAIQLCPPDKKKDLATFYQNRAACYEHLKQFENVINDCTKAIEFNKQYTKAYLRRGKAYEMLENYDQGSTNYFIASTITQFEVSEYVDLLSNCLNNYANKQAKDIVSKRKNFVFQKYVFKQNAQKLIRDPLRIGLKETLDNYESIFNKLFNETDKSDDDNDDSNISHTDHELLFKGTIEMQVGRFEQGIKTLTKLIEISNNEYKINALLKLADYYLQEMNRTKVEECINKALEIDPNNPDIYYARSQFMHLINQSIMEAKNDLNKAIELEPAFAAAIAQNLLLNIETGNFFESTHQIQLKEFENYLEQFPESYELLSIYFQIMMNEGELVKAENAINKGLEIDPDNPIFYVYKGLIEFQKGEEMTKSREYLEKALKMDPNCTLAYEMLAEISSKIEDFSAATDYLQQAIFKSTLYGDIKNTIIKQKYLKMRVETKKI